MIYTNLTLSGVEHLKLDSPGAGTEGFVADSALNGIQVNIQPAGAETTMLYGGAYGTIFSMFATASGIVEGDRVTVSGSGFKYIVKGKLNFNYSVGQHVEYTIIRNQE